jgi:hypothetical protein
MRAYYASYKRLFNRQGFCPSPLNNLIFALYARPISYPTAWVESKHKVFFTVLVFCTLLVLIPRHFRPPPSLFALTIGIDEYRHKDINKLAGAVADADNIEKFLVNNLQVPQANIRSLRNDDATMAAIMDEIRGLACDSRIKKDDPILIFFAGHGSQTKPPDWWQVAR